MPLWSKAKRKKKADLLPAGICLRELRESLGMTQAQLAARLEAVQSQLSTIEHQDDHKTSTLRRYVEGLGGELQIYAVVGGKTVRLGGR